MLPTHAFRELIGRTRAGDAVQAARLLRIVRSRVAQIAASAETQTVLTLAEKRQFLADVVRTPIGWIDENSPLAQSAEYQRTGRGDNPRSLMKVRALDKLRALELDAKLSGELRETPGAPLISINLLSIDGGMRQLLFPGPSPDPCELPPFRVYVPL